MDITLLLQDALESCCGHYNEPLGSIKGAETIEKLWISQCIKMCFTLCGSSIFLRLVFTIFDPGMNLTKLSMDMFWPKYSIHFLQGCIIYTFTLQEARLALTQTYAENLSYYLFLIYIKCSDCKWTSLSDTKKSVEMYVL
jgi:hypothetical protein